MAMLRFLRMQLGAMIKVLRISFFIFSLSGCAFFAHGDKAVANGNANAGAMKIIDASRLKEGGNLLVMPFRAGAGVLADEQLDRVSLMIVKGLVEALQQGNFPFRILSGETASEADLVIKGHIIELSVSKKFSVLGSGNKTLTLSIDGKMVEEKTGQSLVHFTKKEMATQKTEDFMALAYTLGREMGKLVLSGLPPKS